MFSAAFTVEMAVKNAGATGACSILEQIQDIEYADLMTELESGE